MNETQTKAAPIRGQKARTRRVVIPWTITAVAFLLYMSTLNGWVSFASINTVAKVLNWDWQTTTSGALHFLVTLPVRLLPLSWQLPALNVIAALSAAFVLGLLARSVMLLPQDRTRDQRHRELGAHGTLSGAFSWMPAVFAVAVSAFQLTFWENAIADTGEMLDLLVFAYVIRCLLEFRFTQSDSWLFKFAFAYGLGAASNWAMIGFFPLFLIAFVWIKGLKMFQFRFLGIFFACGLLGLAGYLVLPAFAAWFNSNGAPMTFWEALKANFLAQKYYLYNVPFVFYTHLRARLFMISLTSLVPILLVGIRWPSFEGDVSAAARFLTDTMFRALHVGFLILCVWVFFDVAIGPRELGFGLLPYLTFYYISAICVGYCAGYCVIVFGREPMNAWERAAIRLRPLSRGLLGLIVVASCVTPLWLAYKNWPVVRVARGKELHRFASSVMRSLPTKPAVILSDDPIRIFLLEAAYQAAGQKHEHVLLDTSKLRTVQYHDSLKRRFPGIARSVLDGKKDTTLPAFLRELAQSYPIYYLHPSFGYYFEGFHGRPGGLVQRLEPYRDDEIKPPPLTEAEIAVNERFWAERETDFPALLSTKKRSAESRTLGRYYSRSLNEWGVTLQHHKQLKEAKARFVQAAQLNSDNFVAEINSAFNDSLQAGQITPVNSQPFNDSLKKQTWQTALMLFGPFDEIEFCIQIGRIFIESEINVRQGVINLYRALELDPSRADARFSAAVGLIHLGKTDAVLAQLHQIRSHPKADAFTREFESQLLSLEVSSYLAARNPDQAEQAIAATLAKDPSNEQAHGLAYQIYSSLGKTNAARNSIDQFLRLSPVNTWALLERAALNVQLKEHDAAIKDLTLILKFDPTNTLALVNRAFASLQKGDMASARADYDAALELTPQGHYTIYSGLGEIAYRQKNKTDALKNYKNYLDHVPNIPGSPLTPERELVQSRIRELEASR